MVKVEAAVSHARLVEPSPQRGSSQDFSPPRSTARTPLRLLAAALLFLLAAFGPAALHAQTDCLACHSDKDMQNAAGHSIFVDGKKFDNSVHGSLGCNACHSDITGFPHPDHPAKVECGTCHSDEQSALKGSVHASSKDHPCTSCHGDPHTIVPRSDPRSAVYPLNIPRTCGRCHSKDGMAEKHGLPSIYPAYMDSIHGFALSKEGLLVAANCQSCHGSHSILSHKDPQSPTYKSNIPKTCGSCHAKIDEEYEHGVHGQAIRKGDFKAPVCTDCHTAHQILEPSNAAFRKRSTPLCGSCHKAEFSTYRDTFHSQLGSLGGYVPTARCWDCHGAHEILPPTDARSRIAPGHLVQTCSQCHAGANLKFVQYQPHANSRDREHNPALYFIRLFMELLLVSVLTFFLIHTLLWVVRAHMEQIKRRFAKGGKDD